MQMTIRQEDSKDVERRVNLEAAEGQMAGVPNSLRTCSCPWNYLSSLSLIQCCMSARIDWRYIGYR